METIFNELLSLLVNIAGTLLVSTLELLTIPVALTVGAMVVPITAIVVIVMFLIKSGLLSRGITEESFPIPWLISAAITLLAAIGSLGFLLITMQDASIRAAFFNTYDANSTTIAPTLFKTQTEAAYYQGGMAYNLHLAGVWWHMTIKDGLPFFLATGLLIRSQIRTRHVKNSFSAVVRGMIISVIAVVAYAFIIYWDPLFDYLLHKGFPAAVTKLITYIQSEGKDSYDLVMIAFGTSKYPNFAAWFHQQMVDMGGSIYKVASIYPKLFVVFVLFNFLPHKLVHRAAVLG